MFVHIAPFFYIPTRIGTIFVFFCAHMTSRFTVYYTTWKRPHVSIDSAQALDVATSAFFLTAILSIIMKLFSKLCCEPCNLMADIGTILVTASCVATGTFFGVSSSGVVASGLFSIFLALLTPPYMIATIAGLMGGVAASADAAVLVADLSGVTASAPALILGIIIGIALGSVATVVACLAYNFIGVCLAMLLVSLDV